MKIANLLPSPLISLLSLPSFTTLLLLLKPLMENLHSQAALSLTWHLISDSLDHYLCDFDQDLSSLDEDTGIFRHKQVLDDPVKCVFCLSYMVEGEMVMKLRCNHLFHKSCFDGWMEHGWDNCPLCRCSLEYLEAKEKLEEVEDDEAEDSAPPLLAFIIQNEWWGRYILFVVQVFIEGFDAFVVR